MARIILPVSLTVVLFGMTIFLLLIPMIEEKLMDGKREMIQELTESSWSILAAHAEKEMQRVHVWTQVPVMDPHEERIAANIDRCFITLESSHPPENAADGADFIPLRQPLHDAPVFAGAVEAQYIINDRPVGPGGNIFIR